MDQAASLAPSATKWDGSALLVAGIEIGYNGQVHPPSAPAGNIVSQGQGCFADRYVTAIHVEFVKRSKIKGLKNPRSWPPTVDSVQGPRKKFGRRLFAAARMHRTSGVVRGQ